MKYLIALCLVLAFIGCAKDNPVAIPINNPSTAIPVNVLSCDFTVPEINIHDTTLTFSVAFKYDHQPDQQQVQIEVNGRLVNDSLTIVEHPTAVPFYTDSLLVTARVKYWDVLGSHWYSSTQTLHCITINRQ